MSARSPGSPTAPNRTFRDGRHNRANCPRVDIRLVKAVIPWANGARVMSTANDTKRDNRTDGLTEAELSKVAGGTPSIPIPPPRPGVSESLSLSYGSVVFSYKSE
jgi:hypothetical protein